MFPDVDGKRWRTGEEREDSLVLRLLVTEAEHGDQPVVIERLVHNEEDEIWAVKTCDTRRWRQQAAYAEGFAQDLDGVLVGIEMMGRDGLKALPVEGGLAR